ncbi:MAG: hypothetical protein CMJ19_23905 [Phycisphaeraceae bacterium]|nr:hypothetical protein [Phycisphaeraceae bacterium]
MSFVFFAAISVAKAGEGSKVEIAEDGTLVVNGQRKAIYGTFRDPSDDWRQFEGVRQAGFNLTHSYHFSNKFPKFDKPSVQDRFIRDAREYLDLAHANKVGVFMHLPKQAVTEGQVDAIARVVEALKDKPALWLWYIYDEPDVQEMDACQKVYQRIKEVDPDHPVLLVDQRADTLDIAGRACDIIAIDKYTVPYGFHYITDLTEKTRSKNPDKPIWMIHGAHAVQNLHLLRRHFVGSNFKQILKRVQLSSQTHRPNPKELRALQHYSYTIGSPATIFYWLPKRLYDIANDTPKIWDAMVSIGQEFKELEPVLSSPLRSDDTEISSFVVEWLKQEAKRNHLDVRMWTRKYNGKTYVGVVNASYVPHVVTTLKLPEKFSKVYQYPGRKLILDQNKDVDQQYNSQESDVLVVDWSSHELTCVLNECDTVVWEFE